IFVRSLEPLRVTAVKWNASLQCAVARVQMSSGGSALVLIRVGDLAGFMCGTNGVLTSLAGLTRAEQGAIKTRALARGMSQQALYYSIGTPENRNDYGRGGRQLIYPEGLIVYVDTTDHVTDWQRMGR